MTWAERDRHEWRVVSRKMEEVREERRATHREEKMRCPGGHARPIEPRGRGSRRSGNESKKGTDTEVGEERYLSERVHEEERNTKRAIRPHEGQATSTGMMVCSTAREHGKHGCILIMFVTIHMGAY